MKIILLSLIYVYIIIGLGKPLGLIHLILCSFGLTLAFLYFLLIAYFKVKLFSPSICFYNQDEVNEVFFKTQCLLDGILSPAEI